MRDGASSSATGRSTGLTSQHPRNELTFTASSSGSLGIRGAKQRLFDYSDRRTQTEVKVTEGINGYLADAPAVYPASRSKPLSPELAPVSFGSMPRDDGFLLIEPDEYAGVIADPVAAKYVRRFIGARQLINNEPRWCLWMVDLDPADVRRSPVLKQRLEGGSSDALKFESRYHSRVGKVAAPVCPAGPTACALHLYPPRHFSEGRPYATVARFEPDVIAGDSCFTTVDPDGFVFAVLSSSMFIVWQKTVGGRLKSDPRFSKEIVWNTLPLPAVSATCELPSSMLVLVSTPLEACVLNDRWPSTTNHLRCPRSLLLRTTSWTRRSTRRSVPAAPGWMSWHGRPFCSTDTQK